MHPSAHRRKMWQCWLLLCRHHFGNLACMAGCSAAVIRLQRSWCRFLLQGLRDITKEEGALLCFDEVMTGFRIAKGCAQVGTRAPSAAAGVLIITVFTSLLDARGLLCNLGKTQASPAHIGQKAKASHTNSTAGMTPETVDLCREQCEGRQQNPLQCAGALRRDAGPDDHGQDHRRRAAGGCLRRPPRHHGDSRTGRPNVPGATLASAPILGCDGCHHCISGVLKDKIGSLHYKPDGIIPHCTAV